MLPDDETRQSIGASTREDLFGELIDAMPGKWLVWHAGGLLGPRRYACPDHRKALLKSIRFHYAYAGEQWVWKRPPYPQRWPPDGIADSPDGTLTIPEWFAPGPRTAGRRRGRRRAYAQTPGLGGCSSPPRRPGSRSFAPTRLRTTVTVSGGSLRQLERRDPVVERELDLRRVVGRRARIQSVPAP